MKKRLTNYDYINKGISKLEFIIKPIISYNLPLDIVFKIIHASETVTINKI